MNRPNLLILLSLIVWIACLGACSDDDDDDDPMLPEPAEPQLVVSGAFTIDSVLEEINGHPASGAFEHLLGETIEFEFTCDTVADVVYSQVGSDCNTRFLTGPGSLVFSGDPLGFLDGAGTESYQDEPQDIWIAADESQRRRLHPVHQPGERRG